MPEILLDTAGGDPHVRWFREPVLHLGQEAHGYRLLGLIKSPTSAASLGGLWLQTGTRSLRMDDGVGKGQGTNALQLAKYPCDPTLGYSKAVVPMTPSVLKSFIGMLKGLTVYLPPTPLIQEADGSLKDDYKNVIICGTVTLEQMLAAPAAPSARTGRVARATTPAVPALTPEEQAAVDSVRKAKEEVDRLQRIADAKALIAKEEKADADINSDKKVTDTARKDFVQTGKKVIKS